MKLRFLVTGTVLVGSAGAIGFRSGNKVLPGLLAVPPPLQAESVEHGSIATRDTYHHNHVNITQGTFQQLIDHSNPSLGTFTQRFWWSADHYNGPGSPIIVFTPGSINASIYDGYLTNSTITGTLAKIVGGAAIVYESRFFGESTPVTWYTTANMTHLTLENLFLDAAYLAKNIQLPFDETRGSSPEKAPWLLASGGFGGSLVAWTKALQKDNTFWAYLASSASVELFTDFSSSFDVVQAHGPQNCTADVNKVIDYMDNILETGTKDQIHALMDKFGFGELAQPVDMMAALAYGPQYWANLDFSDEHNNETRWYFQWCDYVENVWPGSDNKKTPGAEGVGLERALEGYAKWSREILIPDYCDYPGNPLTSPDWKGKMNVQCFDTFNASSPIYTDRYYKHGGDTAARDWLFCNEPLELWVNGPPKGKPALASRLIDTHYWRRQCALSWPPQNGKTVGVSAGKTAADVNKMTGGWGDVWTNTSRIIFSVGGFENGLPTTVAAKERPGGPLASTDQVPVLIVPGARQNSDLHMAQRQFNDGAKETIDKEIAIMTGWVKDFYKQHNIVRDFVY